MNVHIKLNRNKYIEHNVPISSLVCEADKQKRAREEIIDVAGYPTTHTATPRLKSSRENALYKIIKINCFLIEIQFIMKNRTTYAIFAGLNSKSGMTGLPLSPYTINPISLRRVTK